MKITEIIVKEMSFRRRKVFQIAFTQSLYARGVYVKVLTDEGRSGMGEAVPMPFVTGEEHGPGRPETGGAGFPRTQAQGRHQGRG